LSGNFQFNHQFSFVWHVTSLKPCSEKCANLADRIFTNQNLYQHTLWDTIYGDIWDLDSDESLTHPHCKCYLEVRYESTLDELLSPSKIETFNRGGESVSVARSTATGRFVAINPFQAFGIMTSNIKEMKAEIADFDRDLQRAQNRIENTRAQLISYLLLLQKAGLPPEVDKAISILVRARMTAEQTTRAFYLLMAASGPMGWAMALASSGVALIGAYGVAASTQDLAMDIGGT
jgi:hypothetical protein